MSRWYIYFKCLSVFVELSCHVLFDGCYACTDRKTQTVSRRDRITFGYAILSPVSHDVYCLFMTLHRQLGHRSAATCASDLTDFFVEPTIL